MRKEIDNDLLMKITSNITVKDIDEAAVSLGYLPKEVFMQRYAQSDSVKYDYDSLKKFVNSLNEVSKTIVLDENNNVLSSENYLNKDYLCTTQDSNFNKLKEIEERVVYKNNDQESIETDNIGLHSRRLSSATRYSSAA